MKNDVTLYDKNYKPIGHITTDADGRQCISDMYYRPLGFYYPSTDLTTDFSGRFIGHGNLLTSLLR